jgi:hypothetical protein
MPKGSVDAIVCGFIEGKCGVADDARFVACGIAGIATFEQFDRHAMATGDFDHAVDRQGATGLIKTGERLQRGYLRDRGAVNLIGGGVIMKVRQIGADHDQRLRAAPKSVKNLRDVVDAGTPHRQRNKLEITEAGLQEW